MTLELSSHHFSPARNGAKNDQEADLKRRHQEDDDDEEEEAGNGPAATSPLTKHGERTDAQGNGDEGKEVSVEEFFSTVAVPPWWSQITMRGVGVSFMLGVLFCIISLKLSLTTGLVPSLNVSAGLLGFFFVKTWIGLLARIGLKSTPFTRQENTVIQTCVVACYLFPFSGGFGSYLLSMDQKTYDTVKTGSNGHADSPANIKNPGLGWMTGYVFAVGFLGLVAVVPLRKTMIIDYKLPYPSGTATAVLINSFHMPHGYKQAQKQIRCLGKYFSFSFLFSLFKWFFSGPQSDCGFENFPTLGLKAFDNKFYFDFSMTYVGAGMICSHLVNLSLLLGGILSWGLMWPLINNHAGEWFPADATGSNLQGLYGYKVFIAIALILGDGLYNFTKVLLITGRSLYVQHKKNTPLPTTEEKGLKEVSIDEQRRNYLFLKEAIPFKVAVGCYVVLAAISIGVIPKIFYQMRWYYVLVSYCVAPILGFCNAYGCGMTDWSLVSTYGKLALFIFSAWAGQHGGVIVGLASCGVMMIIVTCAADLMQDFKTGYLTLSSPRSMFLSQIIGTVMGCIISPLTFWMFWKAFPIGDQNGQYKAPYAVIYREMAVLGVQGFSALPRHCLQLSFAFFAFAIIVGFTRDNVPAKVARFIPIPMAMAIPFYIGPYFAIDMCIGTAIVFAWRRINRKKADPLIPAVASGLICGDGVWTLVAAILALAKKEAPICMYFFSSKVFSSLKLPKY